ncbi:MAG: DUF3794 domain-containing protein [Lachnospiraceae bacterium]|nr:DUF3794 domain-containing protein [Lachnospiraceae bacterium]
MEFIQKSIHMDQMKCAASAQVTLEDDINITDAKPDVYQLVMEQGQVDIEEVRAVEDHVHVKGTLKFQVLYISDEEVRCPACMEGMLSFSESVFMNGVSASDNVQVKPVLEDLSVGMINSRKLSVQALVDLSLCVEVVEECQTAVGFEGDENVEMQKKILQALNLVISKKDIFRVREELELPNGLPNIFSLLWQSCELKNISWRILDEKMTLQGELSLFFIYEGEGEERPVIWHEATIPVSGSVECQGMREGMLENIRCRIGHKEIEVKADTDGEERKIALDLVLDLDMKLYEDIQTDMITDMYGVTKEVEAVRQRGRCKQLVMKNTGKQKVNGKFKVAAGLPGIQQLCGSFGEIQMGSTEPCPEGVKIDGAVQVKSIYTTTDPEIPYYCIKGAIPFSYTLEMPAADSSCIYEVEPSLEQLAVSMLDGSEVDAKATLSFAGLCCRVHAEDMVTDVKIAPLDPEKLANLPGIVAYIVKDGDSLWNIGKKYYVPVARMREMNDLGDRDVKAGDKLLVVKGY